MTNKVIYVNASNCHQGGGKTLLDGFIKGLELYTDRVIIYLDERYTYSSSVGNNIQLIKVNKYSRLFISKKIKRSINPDDEIIYFGNLPPILNFGANKVFLMLSSRFYVDQISLNGFTFIQRMKIFMEKLYFNFFLKNVSSIIVQTSTMRRLLRRSGFKGIIHVWAFDSVGDISDTSSTLEMIKEPESFLYVASLLPYKNHKRLLQAWKSVKEAGLNPKLYLTLDQDNHLKKWVVDFVKDNALNVIFLEKLKRDELIRYYEKSEALIYPSFFEAYGLPLIEAKKYKLKIIASDMDYSWDFITPDFFFNPFDVDSITRAIKRYLNTPETLDIIYTPQEFINKLLNT